MLECHPTPTVRNQSAAMRQGPPGELCSCVLTGGGGGLAQSSSAEPSPRRLSASRWGGADLMEEERGPSLTPEQALSHPGWGWGPLPRWPGVGDGWLVPALGRDLGLLECPHPGQLASPSRGIQRERVGGSLDVFHEP